ncbi:MAG: hypothetical protein MUC93_08790 [Bacteroidales bacterium]|jgi:hypothetical protein|nr:hypothetical protein [Bacteroidales bacterium]
MIESHENILDGCYENKVNKALNYFWFGSVIYMVNTCFLNSTLYSYYITQGLQILGFLLFIPASLKLIKWKFDNNYLRLVFTIYFLWSLSIIIRGFQFEYEFIKTMLINPMQGIFMYFAPFVLLFPKKISYYKKTFTSVVILSIFFIFYVMMFYRVLIWGFGGRLLSTGAIEGFATLGFASGFILLTYLYHSGKKNIFALFVIILLFLLAAIRARRGLMLMTVTILLTSYIIFYFTNKERLLKILLSLFLIIFMFIYGKEVYSSNSNGLFGLITGRIDEDTRTGVEEYFYRDMDFKDWIIGKGINGQYYCPGIEEQTGNFTVNRSVIETGYLQIVLKGGLVSLGLYILILIPAIFKGLFYSNNLLSKAAAIWILLFIIYLYPTTINGFIINYLLIWISVGICYDSGIREKTDEQIKAELALNG